ncbi:MAG: hypothetical protein KatS3mg126_1106 [Lysobacteraceae bacterium]|nr:MAG: hypothetical protein KatS3mg126_1106 [Xanthomonadaceae bacterium]
MSRLVIVVEKPSDWGSYYPSENVVSAIDYLREPVRPGEGRVQVINLCRSYRYQGLGYYVSLLAEARGHRVVPSVRTLNDLRRRSLYALDIEDLNQKLARLLPDGGGEASDFGMLVFFGRTSHAPLQDLARQIFESFPCPILRIEFERQRVWQIASIRPAGLHVLSETQEDAFAAALDAYSRKIWRRPRTRRKYRYDLAILHDPDEPMPPSNPRALRQFVAAGRELGLDVELIGRQDFARLAEYDALFLRETTAVDHHTYRFAHRAEREDMVVIDDPLSIQRCTNKIFLHDLLVSRRLPVPRTEILFRDDREQLERLPDLLGLPMVLKVPDGSFSRGVVKVETREALRTAAENLFQQTALLLAQEYLYTEFDWRIGVLNHQPLFACQYFMSRGHWQIYNHAARGKARSGEFRTLALREVPPEVVKLALRAAAGIGDGLYGVDIKAGEGRIAVIEVNDNPNIDAGIEDAFLGPELYRRVMEEFLRRLERKRIGMHR